MDSSVTRSLAADEEEVVGGWEERGDVVEPDELTKRITYLVENEPQRISASEDGWTTLLKDRHDGRFWLLEFPHSDWHGGGPPLLMHISKDRARELFEII